VRALIGDPGAGLPPVDQVDLDGFWVRFDATAPRHLAAGFWVATVVIASLLPRLMGHLTGLARLDADAADAVVQRAGSLPLVTMLTDVAKVVACFAYFSDPQVQTVVQGQR